MYFEVEFNDTIKLKPSYLSAGTHQTIEKQLRSNSEGQFKTGYGILLKVTQIIKIGHGKVSSRTGCASYEVNYKAIVLRPYGGLVVDAVVTNISDKGVWASAGPLNIFIISDSLPEGYRYDYDSHTFSNGQKKLEPDSKIRCRLITATPHTDHTHISATATLKDPYLGAL